MNDEELYLGIEDDDEGFSQYGTPRHSGRYPWGSGKNPRRNRDFISRVEEYRGKGFSNPQIARMMGMTTTEFRKKITIANEQRLASNVARAVRLMEKYNNKSEVGRIMGINESSVRSYLAQANKVRSTSVQNTAEMIKASVSADKYIDVTKGSEILMGVSKTNLKAAVQALKEEGYTVAEVRVKQLGADHKYTTVQVVAPPGTDYKEISNNKIRIGLINGYSEDGGRTYRSFERIKSVDSDRIAIKYESDADGLIELRRGVEDISLGHSQYAQVRIGVDDKLYLKGMAAYGDVPKGYDIAFNTNKAKGTPMDEVLKPLKDELDSNGVFGATVRQRHYVDANGKEQLSAINIVNEAGDWGDWSKTLSSQFLSKQSPKLAKEQLDKSYSETKREYDEIMALTNPTVKSYLLDRFADGCDKKAVDLAAASLPRQASYVILPVPDIPEGKIYAPNFNQGERVVLVRYPHAGRFEIPELTVDNNIPSAKKLMENAVDAVGINQQTAKQLSGADFDGDTVLVIPNNDRRIKTEKPLKGLETFEPAELFTLPPEATKTKDDPKFDKQYQMGMISNLITDMTLKGASDGGAASLAEIERAVKHSMVIIDAEKHNYDWRASEIEYGIAALREKYQGSKQGGASTIISRASGQAHPYARKELSPDPETGAKRYHYTDETYTTVDEKGREHTHKRKIESTKMYEVDDAYDLVSDRGNPYRMEIVYADYANAQKALGNLSRKSSMDTPKQKRNPSAAKAYEKEVESLDAKLLKAEANAPLERAAQIYGNWIVREKVIANPGMTQDEKKKVRTQALAEGRARTGASRHPIEVTPKEWEAIDAGAISPTKLRKILNNTDLDVIKSYATPRESVKISQRQIELARKLLAEGKSTADIADRLDVSTFALNKVLYSDED